MKAAFLPVFTFAFDLFTFALLLKEQPRAPILFHDLTRYKLRQTSEAALARSELVDGCC